MPISMPLFEPKSAEYIYVDSNNKVHLLLPIAGGETIAIDNTCKTAMEMQTFFYGKPGKPAKDGKPAVAPIKSAYEVLIDYEKALQKDIQFLELSLNTPELLKAKRHRLDQIKGYVSILGLVKDKFVNAKTDYPQFPIAIQKMLEKQTNCLSMRLCPREPDHFLLAAGPVFSLNRRPPGRMVGNLWQDPPVPIDGFKGLGPSLRKHLQDILGKPVDESSTPRGKIVGLVTHYYQDKTKPTLSELQQYITRTIAEQHSKNVDLKIASAGVPFNEHYFVSMIGAEYNECTVEESIDTVLNGTLTDDFWAGLKKGGPFSADTKLEDSENAEKITMAIQFFFASVNIYCQANGLSFENFGTELDKRAEEIAKRVARVVATDGAVEAELFNIINEWRRPLGLSRPLNEDDKATIKNEFTMHYNTIKDSPHLDEFIIFNPRIKGDFFNHKSRISVPFLDLITDSLPALSRESRESITRLISSHQLKDNVRVLKEPQVRALRSDNPIPTSTFQSFLDSINEKTYSYCAMYLCSQVTKANDLVTQLSFSEMDALFNHPQWARMEDAIHNHPDKGSSPLYMEAINRAKTQLTSTHEKILCPQGGTTDTALITKPEKWQEAMANLDACIQSYKGKFLYRFKSDSRKEQIKALENILLDLKQHNGPGETSASKMQTLNHALMSFGTLIRTIKESQSAKSTLQTKISGVQNSFLSIFSLQKTAIGINPLDPEKELIDFQSTRLGNLAEHKYLHNLNSSWWSDAALSVIRELPPRYYTQDTVNFLNTTTPVEFDKHVLKAIKTDLKTLDTTTDFVLLRLRGQFIMTLEARNLTEPLKASLLTLGKPWWTSSSQIDKLVSLHLTNLPIKLLTFLNGISPDDIDETVFKGLQYRAAFKQWDTPALTIDVLRYEGQQRLLLGSLSDTHPVLHQLKKEWWTESNIAMIKNLGVAVCTDAVVDFLNKIRPEQLDQQLVRGLQRWNKLSPINFKDIYQLGKGEVPSVKVPKTDKPASTSCAFNFDKHATLCGKINEARQHYETHTKSKWFDIGDVRKSKNDIIQRELTKAMITLSPDQANVVQVRNIVQAAKTAIETLHGEKTWSWFKFQYVIPESGKVLNRLIEELSSHMPAGALAPVSQSSL